MDLIICFDRAGVAQLARVSAFQAEGCGFDPRLPLQVGNPDIGYTGYPVCKILGAGTGACCPCSSVVEHTLGKGEVVGSAPITGSTFLDLGFWNLK